MLQDSYILISIHRMVKELDHETGKIASSYGLTLSQFDVLEALYHQDGLTVGKIKDKILSSNGTVPVIIKNLEKQGMIEREKDPQDQRRTIVKLTAKGRQLIAGVVPENEKMFEEKFLAWSLEEKQTLIRLLRQYREYQREE